MTELRPRLREGLRFAPVGIEPGTDYRVSDPHSGQFFDLGYAEYALISLLDGETTVAEAMSVSARAFRDDALSLVETTELIRWATSAGLFLSGPKDQKAPSPWAIVGAVNPLWMKVSLPSPERVLSVVMPLLGWTQSRAMVVPGVLLFVAAALVGLSHAAEISQSFSGILAMSNWLPLAIVWTALKLWHEVGHAVACRRYDVDVRRCGLVFILLAPCPYVDATAAWSLRSKWQRIHIAAAGMLAEMFIAAIVLLAWPAIAGGLGLEIDPVKAQQLAANTLFSATMATLLFNANPLMKFDGYYMLSDVMDAPNLASRGGAVAKARVARWFYGDVIRIREPFWIELYGWCAAVWRVVVTVSLTAAASVLLPGIGLWIGLIGAFASFAPPVIQALHSALDRMASGRGIARALALAVVCIVVSFTVLTSSWPLKTAAPGVVTRPDGAVVRAGIDGFVTNGLMEISHEVTTNDTLFTLRNDELASQRLALDAEVQQSIARQRMLDADERLAEAQSEVDNRQRLRHQAALLDHQLDSRDVRASRPGMLYSNQALAEMIGTFVREGDELVTVSEANDFEVDVAVADRFVRLVRGRETQQVDIVLPTGQTGVGVIRRVSPSATTRPINESLLTPAGGPVAIISSSSSDDLKTARPYFAMTVLPSDETAKLLREGLRVSVELASEQSVGSHIWLAAQDWWQDLVEQEHAAR